MKFRRIIFDFDGTIITHDKEKESNQIADILNLDESLKNEFKKRLEIFFLSPEIRKLFKNRIVTKEVYLDIIDYVFNPTNDFKVSSKDIDKAIDIKAKYFPFMQDGVIETLQYLYRRGYELTILTNGFYKSQFDILKYKGIDKYFERLYAWDNYYAKPDLRAFYRATENCSVESTAMIGDSIHSDIEPAKKIGIYTVLYNPNDGLIKNGKPDKVIKDFKELMNIF